MSLWEAGLSFADVKGTDLLSRRTLALRGGCVLLIRDGRLIPAADWELSTSDGIPRAYRIGIPEIGGGTRAAALAAAALHFRAC